MDVSFPVNGVGDEGRVLLPLVETSVIGEFREVGYFATLYQIGQNLTTHCGTGEVKLDTLDCIVIG